MKGTRGQPHCWRASWLSCRAVRHCFSSDCDLWTLWWKDGEKRGESGSYKWRQRRNEIEREDQGLGMIPPSCVVQMSDCVQASPVQAFGTGPAWWSLLTAWGEQLCTGPELCRSQLRCGTNRYRSLFTHGRCVCIVLVYLLSVYVLFFDGLPWQPLFCMVIVFWSFCIWQLMALLRCYGWTPQWAFLRECHIFGLLLSKTAPDARSVILLPEIHCYWWQFSLYLLSFAFGFLTLVTFRVRAMHLNYGQKVILLP